ncbi:type IV pilus modification protein PilV [Pseudomonas sp. LRF_L74]|uniref:type IV pilus modification protein PilV n=1 Tax=Pseudomonas sp. LRF_L74 TaxID=3369422 RepID=UPI003F63C9B7
MNISKNAQGFSLIEVLVAIVLICIGVLGMVALQGRTIAYTQDSVQRNAAAALADDLLEMMRADLDAVVSDDGLPESTSDYYKAEGSDFPDAPEDCSSLASLSASERLGCWAARAQASLPGASDLMNEQFHICRTKTSKTCTDDGSTIEIQLAWATKNGECLDSESEDFCTYQLRVEL